MTQKWWYGSRRTSLVLRTPNPLGAGNGRSPCSWYVTAVRRYPSSGPTSVFAPCSYGSKRRRAYCWHGNPCHWKTGS